MPRSRHLLKATELATAKRPKDTTYSLNAVRPTAVPMSAAFIAVSMIVSPILRRLGAGGDTSMPLKNEEDIVKECWVLEVCERRKMEVGVSILRKELNALKNDGDRRSTIAC